MVKHPIWEIKDVQACKDYTLFLTFANGEQKMYDARPILQKELYAALRNPAFFLRAKAEYGTVIWSDEIDIAPEHLYEKSCPFTARARKA